MASASSAIADELRRAIQTRTDALKEQVEDLLGALGSSRKSLRHALELFAFFPQGTKVAVDQEWARHSSSASRRDILRPILLHTNQVGSFVELWLSHGERVHLSHALEMAIHRECSALGFEAKEVVIANGPANNFATIGTDIRPAVFKPLGPLAPSLPAELEAQSFAFFQVPRLEGAEALWRPVLIGHEVAHLAVDAFDAVEDLGLDTKLDLAKAIAIRTPNGTGPVGAVWLLSVAKRWATELLCDAYAVHRFGPAGVTALAEFLTTIGADRQESPSHPPGLLRIELLLKMLGPVPSGRMSTLVRPWRQLISGAAPVTTEWVAFLSDHFSSRARDLTSAVGKWDVDRFNIRARGPIVERLAAELDAGVPGDQILSVDDSSPPVRVTDADAVNACWIARVEGCQMPYQRLTTKCLESNEFVRRWEESGGPLPVRYRGAPAVGAESAVLSEDELRERVFASGPKQLVVTPLLPDFASGAAIDLRLSNGFIVFRRTRTASFDPLSEEMSPRSIQGRTELAWGEVFVLHPGVLLLAATLEYLAIPDDLTAQVITRSSYGRLGMLSATAVQVHPHFHGCLTLELANLGTIPVELTPGERIAQLVVSPTRPVTQSDRSKYHCPTRAQFSKVADDAESEVLRQIRLGWSG